MYMIREEKVSTSENTILCCLGLILGGQAAAINWQRLAPPFWQELVRTASKHNVVPLLYHILAAADCLEYVPPDQGYALRMSYYTSRARSLMLYCELGHMLAALAAAAPQNDVPVVVLKGMALASTIYPDPGLRPMVDIDLLLQQPDLRRLLPVLYDLNYTESHPELMPDLNRRYHHHHRPLQGGPGQAVFIELHWQLISAGQGWRSPHIGWFWQHTEPWVLPQAALQGQPELLSAPLAPVLQLTPTAHLLYLAAHVVLQHADQPDMLIWFYDMHRLITHPAAHIDWAALLAQTRELGWAVPLWLALHKTRRYFGTPLPPEVLPALQQMHSPQALRRMRRLQYAPTRRILAFTDKLRALVWRERLALVRAFLVPNRAYMRWRYRPATNAQLVASYARYWATLAGDGARSTGKLLRS